MTRRTTRMKACETRCSTPALCTDDTFSGCQGPRLLGEISTLRTSALMWNNVSHNFLTTLYTIHRKCSKSFFNPQQFFELNIIPILKIEVWLGQDHAHGSRVTPGPVHFVWPLNNTGLNCVGPLTCGLFSVNIVPYFHFTDLQVGKSLCLIRDHNMWNQRNKSLSPGLPKPGAASRPRVSQLSAFLLLKQSEPSATLPRGVRAPALTELSRSAV